MCGTLYGAFLDVRRGLFWNICSPKTYARSRRSHRTKLPRGEGLYNYVPHSSGVTYSSLVRGWPVLRSARMRSRSAVGVPLFRDEASISNDRSASTWSIIRLKSGETTIVTREGDRREGVLL